MATQNNLKEELLKQANATWSGSPCAGAKSIQEIIAKDEVRVRRMKKLTIFAWVLVVVCFAGAGAIALMPGTPQEFLPVLTIAVGQGLFIIAVSFTVSLYVRSRALTMHQIQASLASIEASLKQLSQKNQ